jgi:hypothetical protein
MNLITAASPTLGLLPHLTRPSRLDFGPSPAALSETRPILVRPIPSIRPPDTAGSFAPGGLASYLISLKSGDTGWC